VLLLFIRFVVVAATLVFLTGMQIGFAPGQGRPALRGLLLASIAVSVGAAVYFGWLVAAPTPWLAMPGAAMVGAGCGLFVWALTYHPCRPGRAFASDPPSVFISGGPYAIARHPIYLSYLLALGGAALLAQSWFVAALTAWMVVLYWYAARMEERIILSTPHSHAYAEYMRRVGPFWPRWRKPPQPASQRMR
jgi:protein-S-isoprenylcysteine O-methyltransferase Ste14